MPPAMPAMSAMSVPDTPPKFHVRFHNSSSGKAHLNLSAQEWLLHSPATSTAPRSYHGLGDGDSLTDPWATNNTPPPASVTTTTTTTTAVATGTFPSHQNQSDSLGYLANLSSRIHTLASSISSTRASIDSHRTHLSLLTHTLTSRALLPPALQQAATTGVASALLRTGNPDLLVARSRRAALHATAASATVSAAMGGAMGAATSALVSGVVTMRMLARGLIGPAALSGLVGVGAAPLVAGVAVGGVVAAGAWTVGRRWADRKHVREAEACVRQLRGDRDALLMLLVAVAAVRRELGGLVAAVERVGVDEARQLGLVEQALERLARQDLVVAHREAVQREDEGKWVAPFEVELASETSTSSALMIEQSGQQDQDSSSDSDSVSGDQQEEQDNQVLIGSTTLAWSSATSQPTSSSTKPRPTAAAKPVQPPPEDASMAASWMLVSKLGKSSTDPALPESMPAPSAPSTSAPVTPVVAPADNAQKEWAAL